MLRLWFSRRRTKRGDRTVATLAKREHFNAVEGPRMNELGNRKLPHRAGKWLPTDQKVLENWLDALIAHVEKHPKPLHPVIEDFKTLIESDAEVYMLFHMMFEQVPTKPPYNNDPNGKPQVRDYHLMLKLFNAIMTRAPEWSE